MKTFSVKAANELEDSKMEMEIPFYKPETKIQLKDKKSMFRNLFCTIMGTKNIFKHALL